MFWLLMCPVKWNHASTIKTNCPTHKPLLVETSCCQLQHHHATGGQQNWARQWTHAEQLSECWKWPLHSRGSFLYACFIIYTLGCFQHNTLSKIKAIHIIKCWHKATGLSRETDTVTNTTLGRTALIHCELLSYTRARQGYWDHQFTECAH